MDFTKYCGNQALCTLLLRRAFYSSLSHTRTHRSAFPLSSTYPDSARRRLPAPECLARRPRRHALGARTEGVLPICTADLQGGHAGRCAAETDWYGDELGCPLMTGLSPVATPSAGGLRMLGGTRYAGCDAGCRVPCAGCDVLRCWFLSTVGKKDQISL